MTRSKLSDSDKQTITQLFRESEETIAQLATRFGVSSSTIRRIIKNQLPDQEYDALIATKQEKRGPKSSRKQTAVPKAEVSEEPKPVKVIDAPVRPAPIKKRKRIEEPAVAAKDETPSLAVAQLDDQEDLAEIIAEIEHDLHDLPADDAEEDSEIDDFDSDDSEDSDLEDGTDADDGLGMNLEAVELIQVLPFSEAKFPKTCYLVVDRSSELITRPLQAFGELGTIPEQEVDAKTLPIFDNHRIARRFSHRTQRIVKVPNSNVLKKTCPQLLAKGITRLLINGHVYSL
ncbi:helix-turn-helix domain-containing protein [Acaryochloris sp. CCMEE 5410]|uniref:helix-turn-helix domain-containing protein n=1 Tax=Acaryochloris sp. CCMEE 5410 TaxID=310037 RepID=UPI00024842F3|nr:helix-turn-helix domain-containing protein [Acaryochloris sp. CCMEE 5410]KAI9134891.1 transposase [Acaryochloris sp. CCMEE 5410]